MNLILLLITSMTSSDVCSSLHKQYDAAEYSMAISHDLNSGLLESARQAMMAKEAARNDVMLAALKLAAAGGPSANYTMAQQDSERKRDQDQIEEIQGQMERDDRAYLDKGDRIISLMALNHCAPVDHVMSWYSYSTSNPNRKQFSADAESQ